MLVASLLTLGPPEQLTGGYLYHRRLAELAPAHGARLDLVPLPAPPFPLAAACGGRGRRAPRLVGLLHQPPGAIDHGRLRRPLQAGLDRALYRRCRLLLLAAEALARPGPPPVPPGGAARGGGGA